MSGGPAFLNAGSGLRVVISGGGTAGHVYPALALLDAWTGTPPQVHWIGSNDGMERDLVTDRGYAFDGVSSAAVRDRSPLRALMSLGAGAKGFSQALRILRRVRPQVVLTTGGYVTVPVAFAAATLRIPVVVFLPDVRPGWAVRAQARIAHKIAVAFPDASAHLPSGRGVHTGYPLRPALLEARVDTARQRLGLTDDLPVVLVYGGSRGARALNNAVASALDEILQQAQVVHVSGTADEAHLRDLARTLPTAIAHRYHLYGFIGDKLVDALVAADLAVARAGASTLAELPAVGLPAILVPGPFSDQNVNAEWLSDRGAATVVSNDEVIAGELPAHLMVLLNDRVRRQEMANASAQLARRDAAARLQHVVEDAVS